MATRTSGFYVPGSASADYVYNKRNEEGELIYESQAADIGYEKQAAIQDLSKTYSDSITSAYSSYLNSKRNLASSTLGEKFKQAYLESQKQTLQQNLQEVTTSAAEARQQIESSASSALEELSSAYQTEVGYMDRTQQQLQNYWTYLSGLTKTKDGTITSYLTDEQKQYSLEDAYDTIYNALDVGDYTDTEGAVGKSFLDWQASQVGTTEADQKYWQWLIGGGYTDYQTSTQSYVEASRYKKLVNTPGTSEYRENITVDKINAAVAPTVEFNKWDDFGWLDFGTSGYDKIKNVASSEAMTNYLAAIDLTDAEVKELTGLSVKEAMSAIAKGVSAFENGADINRIINLYKNVGFNAGFVASIGGFTQQLFKSFNTGNVMDYAQQMIKQYMTELKSQSLKFHNLDSEA